MPGAGRTREPCVQRNVHCTARKQHRYRRNNRHSLRNGFNGLLRALPGVPGLLATVALRNVPQDLTPASGGQDHTAWPSAKRPSSTRQAR